MIRITLFQQQQKNFLSHPLSIREERRDLGYDKAHAVQDQPCDADALQPSAAFIDRLAAAREIHHQQGDGGRHDGRDGRDEHNLTVHVFLDLAGFGPDVRRGIGGQGHHSCHRDGDKCRVRQLRDQVKPAPFRLRLLVDVRTFCFVQ